MNVQVETRPDSADQKAGVEMEVEQGVNRPDSEAPFQLPRRGAASRGKFRNVVGTVDDFLRERQRMGAL